MRLTKRASSAFTLPAFILATSIQTLWLTPVAFAQASSAAGQNSEAQALVRTGHWKRARAILEPQVKAHPDDPRSCYLLAEVRMSFRDLEAALPLAQHAVDLDAGNSNYHLGLGKVYGEMADRASFFSAGSLAVKFRKQVEAAISLDPQNLDALDAMMQFKYQAPGIMGGSKDEAYALADRITALDSCEGNLSHAELAELEKNPGHAESFYQSAVQANPKNYAAQVSLAKFYSQPPRAQYVEAIQHAQSALQIDPKRVDAYWVLAKIFSREQRWTELEQTLSNSGKSVTDDVRPFYEAAQSLLEVGKDYKRAEGYARHYLSQEPEGEEPDAADAHRLLGLLLEREGQTSEARAEIQTALRLRPTFKSAKDDLRRMEQR